MSSVDKHASLSSPKQNIHMDISGEYRVEETNPSGSPYKGNCTVAAMGNDTYRFTWHVGGVYQGQGTLEGDTISVDWGDTFPVVYKVQEDGVLRGYWANHKATEILKPAR